MKNIQIVNENRMFQALGTVNTIRVTGEESGDALRPAIARVHEIESRMSAFLPESDLGRLAESAGKSPAEISPDTFALLEKAKHYAQLSGGAFEPTIRPLTKLWGIGKKACFVPSEEEIAAAMSLVNWRSLQLKSGCRAYLEKPGQAVDLGGIAKGYAADEVRRILLENGVASAMINLGGNISAVGSRPDGSPWRIGVQNPFAPRGEFLGTLEVRDRTVVTSGVYERYFYRDGVRYHHILDPRTGKPVRNGLMSVTAVCGSSADADALTTALFVLGPQAGAPLLRQSGADAIFVFEDYSFAATSGLRNSFCPAQLRKDKAV